MKTVHLINISLSTEVIALGWPGFEWLDAELAYRDLRSDQVEYVRHGDDLVYDRLRSVFRVKR